MFAMATASRTVATVAKAPSRNVSIGINGFGRIGRLVCRQVQALPFPAFLINARSPPPAAFMGYGYALPAARRRVQFHAFFPCVSIPLLQT
jgi:phosphoglycerate dehydrogenase-like enzyme